MDFGCGGQEKGGGGGGEVWPGWLVAIIRGQSHPKSTRNAEKGMDSTKVTAGSLSV